MTILQFINVATGSELAVGKGLDSCTTDIQTISATHPKNGHHIVFIDSPGFDDTWVDDAARLEEVSDWLVKR
jgi:predicted GTPase